MRVLDWFKRGPRQETEPPEEWWEALSRLEHEMEQLQLSWEETYGKVRRALASLARRQSREEAADEPTEPATRPNGHMTPHEIGERLRAARARYNRS